MSRYVTGLEGKKLDELTSDILMDTVVYVLMHDDYQLLLKLPITIWIWP